MRDMTNEKSENMCGIKSIATLTHLLLQFPCSYFEVTNVEKYAY